MGVPLAPSVQFVLKIIGRPNTCSQCSHFRLQLRGLSVQILASCSICTWSWGDDARRARRRARSAVFLVLRASASNDACVTSNQCAQFNRPTQPTVCDGRSQTRRPSRRAPYGFAGCPAQSRGPYHRAGRCPRTTQLQPQHQPTHKAPPKAPSLSVQRLTPGRAAARQRCSASVAAWTQDEPTLGGRR